MFQYVLMGIIQGIAEWLPISSEAALTLVQAQFFGSGSFLDMVRIALWLHLGTFFAALIYFRKDVVVAVKALFAYRNSSVADQKLIAFLVWTTLISGALGGSLLLGFEAVSEWLALGARGVTFFIGFLLLGTATLLFFGKKHGGQREIADLQITDYIVLGIAQGLSALPGFSRSGLTVSALLLRKVDDQATLKLSFLMSLPIVLGANVVLNLKDGFLFNGQMFVALVFSFIFGYATIDVLLRVARSLRFDYFVLIFAVITFVAALMM